MGVPKGLEPTGVILADKPAGPSSFAIVARVRGRTGAKTGHAGTLDPFATGLLILLSGRATSLQDRFMKLDKRYLTEIDLHGRTTTGDPEGEPLDEQEPPTADELEDALDACAARSSCRSLPRPPSRSTASGPIGSTAAGSRSRCPPGRCASTSSSSWPTRTASRASTCSSARAPTSARSPTRSAATAHPAPHRDRAVRGRGGGRARACSRSRRRCRDWRSSVRIAHAPTQLERRPRAVAIGTFDGVHRGHLSVLRTVDSGLDPTVITLEPHPRIALGNRVELITTLERRLELLAEAGIAETLVAAFTPEFMRLSPDQFVATYLTSIGAEAVAVGNDFRFGHKRSGTVETLIAAGPRAARRRRGRGCLVDRCPGRSAPGGARRGRAMLGRPFELDGIVVAGDQRGGTLGYPTANIALGPDLLCPRYGIYAGAALDHRAAVSIGTNPHYGGTERRIEPYLLDFDGDLYGKRLVVELWERLRDEQAFESEAALVAADRPRRRGDAGRRAAGLARAAADEDRLRAVLVRRVARDDAYGEPGLFEKVQPRVLGEEPDDMVVVDEPRGCPGSWSTTA